MEYIIKIKSESDNLIIVDDFIKKVINKNSFITLSLKIENNENFIINVEPLEISDKLYLPYKIYVENQANALKIKSNNIEILSFENTYIIKLKNLLATKNMNVLNSTNSYSIFNTYCTNITTKNTTINLPSLFNFKSAQKVAQNTVLCFEKEFENDKLLANSLNNSFDTNKNIKKIEKYVVVINGNEIIFNDFYNQINLDGKIEILSCLNDIAKHAILTQISDKSISQKTVYEKNEPVFTFSPKIIPLAFLQALKVNNIKLCKHYLGDNLKDVANLEMLNSYFKDYKKIEFDNNRYILFYKDFSHKIVEFTVLEDKICKIDMK